MEQPVIRVRNLGKRYSLRSSSTKTYHTMRDDLIDGIKNFWRGSWWQNQTEDFWALQDVGFDVNRGEVVGIIGRNGAGKSTLLKILSRIVKPTTGEAIIRGRVGSLLEVGTGFHPELTGRENIFMNGSLLGMKRAEIKLKFDEIVAFAEVEKFLDTPVKFYSSGMYVRLAFAVAAHLEPEILIVDEVLAVGDAAFQKKCLGKMSEVSAEEGKTILFVSHNMAAVKSLCSHGIWISGGKIQAQAETGEIIAKYLATSMSVTHERIWDDPEEAPGNEKVKWHRVSISPPSNDIYNEINVCTPLVAEFECWNHSNNLKLNFSLHLFTIEGVRVFNTFSYPQLFPRGLIKGICYIPGNLLNNEVYYINIMLVEGAARVVHELEESLMFEVHDVERKIDWYEKWQGVVRPDLQWQTSHGELDVNSYS